MRRHLNELTIKSLPFTEAGQIDYWDSTLPRFGLRIGKHTKTFILNAGKRRITLGRYGLISLKQARDEARRRIGLKYLPQTSLDAKTAADQYLREISSEKKPGTIRAYSIYLQRLPALPLHQLDPQNLLAALPESKSAANLCFATFKAFFSWCVEKGHIDTNPLLQRRTPNKLNSRDRLLTDDEIRLIWKESFNHEAFGAIARLLLLTGQRLNQITSLQRIWLQTDQIAFPAYIMKNGQEHIIPLTPMTAKHIPSSPNSSILPQFHIATAMKKFRSRIPQVPHFTLHDFRRYLSSTMSKLGVPIDVTEAILAHTTGSRSQIQRVYDRDKRIPQMRTALETYEQHLLKITGT